MVRGVLLLITVVTEAFLTSKCHFLWGVLGKSGFRFRVRILGNGGWGRLEIRGKKGSGAFPLIIQLVFLESSERRGLGK